MERELNFPRQNRSLAVACSLLDRCSAWNMSLHLEAVNLGRYCERFIILARAEWRILSLRWTFNFDSGCASEETGGELVRASRRSTKRCVTRHGLKRCIPSMPGSHASPEPSNAFLTSEPEQPEPRILDILFVPTPLGRSFHDYPSTPRAS